MTNSPLALMREQYVDAWSRTKDRISDIRAKDIIKLLRKLKGDEDAVKLAILCVTFCGMKATLEDIEEELFGKMGGKDG